MKENPNNERITVQMPLDFKQQIEEAAAAEGRSASAEALRRLRSTFTKPRSTARRVTKKK